jgi:hypothetical protein
MEATTGLELARSRISLHILVQNRNNQYIIKLQCYYWKDENSLGVS